MQEEEKKNYSAGKRSIIVLFTDAPGLLLTTYKNTIHFLFICIFFNNGKIVE